MLYIIVKLLYYLSMLPKKYRLKNKIAFNATYRVNNSHKKNGIVLIAGLKKKNDTPTKVGFVVSKKTHKRAVKRNRLKRLMRESYRILLKEGSLGNSQEYMSMIFLGRERALNNDFKKIKQTISELLMEL